MSASNRATRERQTYTLMDTAVILSVLATLMLLVAPTISASIRESRVSRAGTECYRIAVAVDRYVEKTGLLPAVEQGGSSRPRGERPQVLAGPGLAPAEVTLTAWSNGRIARLRPDLIGDPAAAPAQSRLEERPWDETSPAALLPADPWGRRYMLNVESLQAGIADSDASGGPPLAVWVLSAGPNGIIETPFRQHAQNAHLAGDDIGVRIQ